MTKINLRTPSHEKGDSPLSPVETNAKPTYSCQFVKKHRFKPILMLFNEIARVLCTLLCTFAAFCAHLRTHAPYPPPFYTRENIYKQLIK